MEPQNSIDLDAGTARQTLRLIDALEENGRRAGSLRELRHLRGSHGGGGFVGVPLSPASSWPGWSTGRRHEDLAAMLVASLVGSACSAPDERRAGKDVIAGASKQHTMDLASRQTKTDGGIGDGVEAGTCVSASSRCGLKTGSTPCQGLVRDP